MQPRCNIHPREFSQEFRAQLASDCHLRFLANNPDFDTSGGLLLVGNENAVFSARQGRQFAKALLALGDFFEARKTPANTDEQGEELQNLSRLLDSLI